MKKGTKTKWPNRTLEIYSISQVSGFSDGIISYTAGECVDEHLSGRQFGNEYQKPLK